MVSLLQGTFTSFYCKVYRYIRAVAATTAGTAMAVPVFVSTKKKWILCATAHESYSLVKPDSHMHAHTRACTTIKVQSSNSEHVLAVESAEYWESSCLPRLVKYPTNLSVISFQDASLASPKLSVAFFKDHCLEHSELFFHVCFSV